MTTIALSAPVVARTDDDLHAVSEDWYTPADPDSAVSVMLIGGDGIPHITTRRGIVTAAAAEALQHGVALMSITTPRILADGDDDDVYARLAAAYGPDTIIYRRWDADSWSPTPPCDVWTCAVAWWQRDGCDWRIEPTVV